MSLSGKAAIAGIGATDFSKNSGRSELRLAAEAVLDALDDAGLTPADVDGMVTFTMDSNTEVAVARATGIGELKFFSKIHHGGGAACATGAAGRHRGGHRCRGLRCGLPGFQRTLGHAVRPGADAFGGERRLHRRGQLVLLPARPVHPGRAGGDDRQALHAPVRRDQQATSARSRWPTASTPPRTRRRTSTRSRSPSRIIRTRGGSPNRCGCWTAARRPTAASPWSIVSAERAKDLKHRPAVIEAAAQGASPDQYSMVSYYRPELDGLPEMGLVGKQLWAQSGLKPTDIQTAILYDHFTPFTLIQLEELGFCGWGEAKDFIADGAIEIGGRLPINTHGGQLGEAYIHGMNGIAEGVRQLRGTSVNPVPDVEHVLVTAGTGVPTSGLILASCLHGTAVHPTVQIWGKDCGGKAGVRDFFAE